MARPFARTASATFWTGKLRRRVAGLAGALAAYGLAAVSWADDALLAAWGSTLCGTGGLGGATEPMGAAAGTSNPGWRLIWALLLILTLVLVLAWLARKFGWLPQGSAAADKAGTAPEIIFFAQFNARQALAIERRPDGIRCLVTDKGRLELMADVPAAKLEPAARPGSTPAAGKPKTFQEVWSQLLKRKSP